MADLTGGCSAAVAVVTLPGEAMQPPDIPAYPSLVITIEPLEENDNAQNQAETENRLNELFGEPEYHRFI